MNARDTRSARWVASVPVTVKRMRSCGWDQLLNQFSPLDLQRMACAVMHSLCDLRRDRFENFRMIVPENQRAMAAEIIDVFVAIHIPFA